MRRTLQMASSLAARQQQQHPPMGRRRLVLAAAPKRAGVVRARKNAGGFRWQSAVPSSNSFWISLNESVREGNGFKAEELVNGLLGSLTEQPGDQNRSLDRQQPLDTRVFSLVLEAWRNSKDTEAPHRSRRLLEQMIALADEDMLREQPSQDDFHAVLECYKTHGNNASMQTAESALAVANLMAKEHPLTPHTNSLVLSVLANGGHFQKAIRFLEEQQPSTHTRVSPDATTTNHHHPNNSLELYNYILLAYARSHHPDAAPEAHALLQRMRKGEHGLPLPDGTSYDLVLECWQKASHHRQPSSSSSRRGSAHQPASMAKRLLQQMKADQVRTTLVSYQSVISILAEQGEAKQAEQLLTNLIKDYGAQFDADLKPNLEPFQTVLRAYSKCFHPDSAPRATSILQHMRELHQSGVLETRPDTYSYNLVLKCWMHSRKPEATSKALGLLDEMQEQGVFPDTTTLNSVLNTLAKHKSPSSVEDQLRWFLEKYLEDPLHHPPPDVVSFGTALKAWANAKDSGSWERAEALLLKLQSLSESGWDRCQPDLAIYSSVMKCYANSKAADAPHKSEALLRSIQEAASHGKGPKPDTVCWNMAIYGWAQAGQGERAEALFREMLREHTEHVEGAAAPNSVTFSAVLSAWAKTRDDPRAPEKAESLLQTMKHLHQDGNLPDAKPNVVNYSIVLDCLAYAKTSASAIRAEDILREMQDSRDEDVMPNVVSYNSVIKAWSLSRDAAAVPRITALLKELLRAAEAGDQKMVPNENTFGSVLKALADSNLPDKEKRAEVVVNLMEKFGIEWNAWSRKQLRRCSAPSTKKNDGGSRGRRGGKGRSAVPEIPDLKYSS